MHSMHLDIFSYLHAPSFIHAFSCARSESVRARWGFQNIGKRSIFKFSSNKQGVRSQRARGQSRKHACWCDCRSKLEWVCFSTVPRVSVGLAWVSWCWCDCVSSPSTHMRDNLEGFSVSGTFRSKLWGMFVDPLSARYWGRAAVAPILKKSHILTVSADCPCARWIVPIGWTLLSPELCWFCYELFLLFIKMFI